MSFVHSSPSLKRRTTAADQPAILERAFRSSALTSAAKKELTALRRNSVVGENLYRALLKVYDQHRLREQTVAEVTRSESQVPRVICSEGLA